MNTNLSFSVFTANIISLLLIGTLYFSNRQRISHDKDMHSILQMMLITSISNIADCCVFYFDGNSGTLLKIIVFLSGAFLFLGNVLFGYTWAKFIMSHMNIIFSNIRKRIYKGIIFVACSLLIINIFYPIIFTNKTGLYQRGPLYIIFLVFALFYILDSLYLYINCRKKIGTLQLFPVHIFLIPVAIGVIVQAFFPEIAITWTTIAIAISGIMTSLKNELIFMDCLTGLYNRVYLEFLQKQACKKKSNWVSGIMIDLNGFKQINDNYGHSEGDAALVIAADLLRKSFCEYGIVTRYAGDEFVVMLNTTDETIIKGLIEKAKENFDEENKRNKRPYKLSASMGYGISDLSMESIYDFMNRIDKQMYKDKLLYYENNV